MRTPLKLALFLSLLAPACAVDPSADDAASGDDSLRRCSRDEPCVPPGGGGGGGGTVRSYPDVVLELVLPPPASCNGAGIADVLRQELGRNFVGSTIEMKCLQGTRAKVGVWMRPLGTSDSATARGAGLDAVTFLASGESAAIGIPAAAMRKQLDDRWREQPKAMDHAGNANTGGPVFLDGKELTFDGANRRVAFTVTGHDTTPIPDVHFTYKLTDTFGVAGGAVTCSSQTSFDKNDELHWALGGLFLGLTFVAPWITPIFTFTLANAFFLQGTIISSVGAPAGQGQSFCDAAKAIPQQILLRGQAPYIAAGQKLRFDYGRVATDAGIAAGGSWSLAPRQPRLTVAGTRYLDVVLPEGHTGPLSLTATVTARTDDMIGPDITFTPDPGATVQTVASQATFQSRRVTWQVPSVVVGQEITRNVAGSAVDDEGLLASGSTFFVFRIVAPQGTNPVCRAKPWLPGCAPGAPRP